MCGVGLCGGCECGGRLLCKEGTFVSLQYLRAAGVRLAELDASTSAPGAKKPSRRTAASTAR